MIVCACIEAMTPEKSVAQAGSEPALHVQFVRGGNVVGGLPPEMIRGDEEFVALKGCKCQKPTEKSD